MNKEYVYLVGIWKPDFCDQAYIQDRWEVMDGESQEEVVKNYIQIYINWLRPDEYSQVKVISMMVKDRFETIYHNSMRSWINHLKRS